MSKSNPAVVLGLNPNGLGIVKSLRAVKIPVIGVDHVPGGVNDTRRWMSSRTRLCRKVFYREEGSAGLLKCLIALGKTLDGKGVLFPSGDTQLLCVSEHRDELAPYYHFRVPDADAVAVLYSKARFNEFAVRNNIAHPATLMGKTPDDVLSLARDMTYPCLIKPYLREQNWAAHFGARKVFTAANADELTATYQRIFEKHHDLIIQEIVGGPDSNLYFSHVYMSSDLNPLAIWTGRKIRQLPIHFGTSTLAETVWVDEVADTSVKMLQKLRCPGYSSIEFKKDPSTGAYKVIEVTAGRTWYPHYLGVAAGVNIPEVWYRDLLGIKQGAAARAKDRVRWIDEYRDLFAVCAYRKSGELSFTEWLGSYRKIKGYALASFRDPLPIFLVAVRLALGVPDAVLRRFRKPRKVIETD